MTLHIIQFTVRENVQKKKTNAIYVHSPPDRSSARQFYFFSFVYISNIEIEN